MSYQIKMVSDMLGIPKNTLIAWERRYGVVDPDRTESGYRVYSDLDVTRLREVQSLLDQGYKVGEACRIVNERLPGVLDAAREAPPTDLGALATLKEDLKQCLLSFDREGADRVTARLVLVPFEQSIDAVYFPLLRDIGQGWELGKVTIVQEHYATAYAREKMLVMLNSVQTRTGPHREVTCATPPGEQHELGLLALAVRLAIRGFRVTYLGTNVPTSDLVAHVNERKPYALCLSMVHSRPVGEVLAFARELRARVDDKVRIAIGGRAAAEPDLFVAGVSFNGHGFPAWLEGTVATHV